MDRNQQIDELLLMFPQHNNNVISGLYDNISENFGNEAQFATVVFESCIERLLEMNDSNTKDSAIDNNKVKLLEEIDNFIPAQIVFNDLEDNKLLKKQTTYINSDDSVDSLENDLLKMDQSYRTNNIIKDNVAPLIDKEISLFQKEIAKYVYRDPERKSPDFFQDDHLSPTAFLDEINNMRNSKFKIPGNAEINEVVIVDPPLKFNESKKRKYSSSTITAPPTKISLIENSKGLKKEILDNSNKTQNQGNNISVVEDKILNHNKQRTPSCSNINKNETKLSTSSNRTTSVSSTKTSGSPQTFESTATVSWRKKSDLPKEPYPTSSVNTPQTTNSNIPSQKLLSSQTSTQASNVSPSNKISPTLSSSSTNTQKQDPFEKQKVVSPEPDVTQLKVGSPEFVSCAVKKIKNVIEDVDLAYLRKRVEQYSVGLNVTFCQMVAEIVTQLLDEKNYPKQGKNVPKPPESECSVEELRRCGWYIDQVRTVLKNHFPQIAVESIYRSMNRNKNDFYKTYKDMEEHIKNKSPQVKFMKKPRRTCSQFSDLHKAIKDVLEKITSEKKQSIEKCDLEVAYMMNSKQYEQEGQAIECGCCYIEAAFEAMVQCDEGHLFCAECLRRYSKEIAFGEGKAELFCMTDGCDGTFPQSQLLNALPKEIMSKYFERQQEEYIQLANIENLVRCPACNYAAEMADGDKVFKCQNSTCMKETCRFCQEEWEGHFGLKCSEVEKKEVTSLRKSYEEKMTEAKVRKCWKCKTIFLKSDGCNKMTCRCGAKMCYICRQPKIDYQHFCQHVRDPGNPCSTCTKCSLWTDPSEDDDRAVAEIQKIAEQEKAKIATDEAVGSNSSIGPKFAVKPKPQQPVVNRNAPGQQMRAALHEMNDINVRYVGGNPLPRHRIQLAEDN